MAIVRIPLHSRKYPGLFALIDEEDYPLVSQYRWYPHKTNRTFYAIAHVRGENGKRSMTMMHRMLLDAPAGMQRDHRDGDGLNNARENLRVCSAGENNRNSRPALTHTSTFKGVSLDRRRQKWLARIKLDGRHIYLGLHSTEEQAARAYDAKARELFGEFARLNFPDDAPIELPSHAAKAWFTEEEDMQIIALRERGLSWLQIGRELNRRGSVAHRRYHVLLSRGERP